MDKVNVPFDGVNVRFDGLEFPVHPQQISKFEKKNVNISVNVYRLESIYTWQCGGLAYPTREMQGSALRRSIAGCCKKFPSVTLRAASR